jgi:glycosyltransferase involved in cell wall biosynthesis
MGACWREFAGRDGVDLLVLNPRRQKSTAFDEEVTKGFNHRILNEPTADAYADAIREHGADVVSLSGWMYPAFLQLAADATLKSIPFVMSMDTPLRRGVRQQLGRLRLRSYFNRMSRVIVPGERAWQYARFLGFSEARIRRGLYGIDYASLAPLRDRRQSEARPSDGSAGTAWPKRFLFLGRYMAEKGLDVLTSSYRKYRASVADPWPLTCYGMGPLRELVAREPGIHDAGFAQPAQVLDIMLQHGALVLASRFDPWPLVIAEGCAAGMPVICTEACGSAVELVRDGYNGFAAATGDVDSLAYAMLRAHQNYDELPEMGRRSQCLAAPYSAQNWANRWDRMLREVTE